MARLLLGAKRSFLIANYDYAMILHFLRQNGWVPSGTAEPVGWGVRRGLDSRGQGKPWNATLYFVGHGQRVMPGEALAMAERLEDLWPDIPSHDVMAPKVGMVIDLPYHKRIRVPKAGVLVSGFEYFSGEQRAVVRRFINFALEGGFAITQTKYQ